MNIFLFSTFGSAIGIDTIVAYIDSNIKLISYKLLVELFFIIMALLDTSTMTWLLNKNVQPNIPSLDRRKSFFIKLNSTYNFILLIIIGVIILPIVFVNLLFILFKNIFFFLLNLFYSLYQ